MAKTASKSTIIMFLFDFFTFTSVSVLLSKSILSKEIYSSVNLLNEFLIIFLGLFVLFLKGNYKIREFNISLKNTYLLLEGITLAHISSFILLYLTTDKLSALKYTLLDITFVFCILQLYRMAFHVYLFRIKRTKNIIIIGTNKKAQILADEISNKKALRMQVKGFISENSDIQTYNQNIPVYTKPFNLKDIIKLNSIDIVIIALSNGIEEEFLSEMLFAIPDNVSVYRLAEFYEMITGKYFIEKSSVNHLFFEYMEKRSNIYKICKRCFDIASAGIILVLTLPILICIAVRVKSIDGGSPLYTQTRVGRGGKSFKMYKLRTMYINDYVPTAGNIADTGDQDKDNRVIPFCKLVRKTRFDEIPQMINIIKGDMSIVGPRTEWEDLVKIYSKEIPYYNCRQWIKTGWTGWAQINQGHCVLNDDIEEKLQYDLYYLKNRNIFWEFCILIKAIFMALGGRHE